MYEWTFGTLRKHLERRIDDNDLRYEQRFQSSERALVTALDSANKRLDAMNEVRGQLSDQARLFMPRLEFEAQHRAIVDQISLITSRLDKIEGTRGGTSQTIAWAIAAFAALAAGITVIVTIVTH